VPNVHGLGIYCFAQDKSNDLIFTGSMDRSIGILDIKDRFIEPRMVHKLRDAHNECVDCLQFCEKYRLLYSGSCDRSIKIWSFPTKNIIPLLLHHLENVNDKGIGFMYINFVNQHLIVTGKAEKNIKIFDLAGIQDSEKPPQLICDFVAHDRGISHCQFDPISHRIYSAGLPDNTLNIFSSQDCSKDQGPVFLATYKNFYVETVKRMAVDTKNQLLYIVDGWLGTSLKMFNVSNGISAKLVHLMSEVHKSDITSLMLDTRNQIIYTGSRDKSIKLFRFRKDIVRPILMHHFEDVHEGAITALYIDPVNPVLYSGSYDLSIKVILVQTTDNLPGLRYNLENIHKGGVNCLCIDP
jgi:WD40 repeat protein